MDLSKINKVYLSGIGGIGLSALAYYFLQLGKEVEGSDLIPSEITKRLEDKGVYINKKQKAVNIDQTVNLFIYSSALPDNHPELVKAKELKIPIYSYFQFLGHLSKSYQTIAITGTNGKTTTTAMLGLMLERAGLDPTVIVGSLVPQWQSNFRYGQSDILVVEACEWQAHMLEINPQIIVLTNIAEDHLDYYKDLNDIQKHFQKFADKLPDNGLLIKNKDDLNSQRVSAKSKVLTFGQDNSAGYVVSEIKTEPGQQSFIIKKDNKLLGEFELKVPGNYNIYNASAAAATADYLGVNKHQIWNSLREFEGTWRRFELLGEYKGNVVISDYAHHPDGIKQLLQATKDFYPTKELLVIFQPHHHNRTKTLFNQFVHSFTLADQLIISEIYQVSGREDEVQEDVSSKDLVKAMEQETVYYAADAKQVTEVIRKLNPTNSVILFVGAGDIDNLARQMVK